MRFKSIFLSRTLLFCVLFLFINHILLAQLSSLEKRCLWVIRESMYNKSSIDKALLYANKSGYDIVFLQIRGRGYAFYNSEFIPKHPKIDSDFDPLSYAISLGDSLDLEIHVWMNTYMLWSSPYEPKKINHIYHTKKEWTEAIFFRKNIFGRQLETWHHVNGCRMWIEVERCTKSHKIYSTKPVHPGYAKLLQKKE